MSSFNKITIVGYLGRDPELRYTPQGSAVCNFSIATTEKWRDIAGAERERTTWFRITTWGKQAELANQYLAKGRQVYIEGRLRLEEYTDREGGRRASLEVTASDLRFLGGGSGKSDEAAPEAAERGQETGKARAGTGRASQTAGNIEEDEIPF